MNLFAVALVVVLVPTFLGLLTWAAKQGDQSEDQTGQPHAS